MTWLPEIVKLMRSLSANSAEVSVADLAELIKRDPTILAKVIGAANTMGFNPSAVPVSSVTQAIHVIGYERIRTLAMSLMLSENSIRTRSPDEQREAIALALTSGCVAQSAAGGRVMLDPGRAFVCGSLRHFGRIVMTACMEEEFRQAMKASGSEPNDDAFRTVFGLTPLELGRELLKSSDLPPEILACLRELPPEALSVLDTVPDARMLALTEFAGRLAEMSLGPDPQEGNFVEKVSALAAHYDPILPGMGDEIPKLLRSAEQQLNSLVRHLKLGGVSARSLNRLRQHCTAVETKDAQVEAPAAPPPPVRQEPAAAAAPFDWLGEEARFEKLLAKPGLTRDELFNYLCERLRLGLDAPDCLLFSGSPNQPVHAITHGHGMLFQSLRAHARVRADERTVFGICLSRRENVLIHRADDPAIRAYFPPWLGETNRLGAFALLPLVNPPRVHGLVLIGWRHSHQIQIGTETAKQIRNLLALACRACELPRMAVSAA